MSIECIHVHVAVSGRTNEQPKNVRIQSYFNCRAKAESKCMQISASLKKTRFCFFDFDKENKQVEIESAVYTVQCPLHVKRLIFYIYIYVNSSVSFFIAIRIDFRWCFEQWALVTGYFKCTFIVYALVLIVYLIAVFFFFLLLLLDTIVLRTYFCRCCCCWNLR